MAQKWFYQLLGETIGPVMSAELRQYARNGTIDRDTLVRTSDHTDWVTADKIRGLFETPSQDPIGSGFPSLADESLSQSNDIRDDRSSEEYVEFSCPHCNASQHAGVELAGKTSICEQCHSSVLIPAASPSQSSMVFAAWNAPMAPSSPEPTSTGERQVVAGNPTANDYPSLEVDYPALEVIVGLHKLLAGLTVVFGVVGLFVLLTGSGEKNLMQFVLVIVSTVLVALLLWGTAELIVVLVRIERNTRRHPSHENPGVASPPVKTPP